MVEIVLSDGGGGRTPLQAETGEPICDVLLRNYVPPGSVLVTVDGTPVASDHRVQPGHSYEARNIEGYDLESVRSLFRVPNGPDDAFYAHRRLSFDDASPRLRRTGFDSHDVESHVERTVRETITHYGLVEAGDTVVVGLSGGTDSAALQLALDAMESELPAVDLVAVTIEEPWPEGTNDSVARAEAVVDATGVEHRVVERSAAQELFRLREPLPVVVADLASGEYSEHVAAIVNHVQTRLLEHHAADRGADSIAIGIHASELVAGLLNADIAGYAVGGVPRREVNDLALIYPLSLLPKQELAVYTRAKMGPLSKPEDPNPWLYQPDDRSFYYYLADVLLWYWPGLQYWLVESHRDDEDGTESVAECGNCGNDVLADLSLDRDDDLCAACTVFEREGFLEGG